MDPIEAITVASHDVVNVSDAGVYTVRITDPFVAEHFKRAMPANEAVMVLDAQGDLHAWIHLSRCLHVGEAWFFDGTVSEPVDV